MIGPDRLAPPASAETGPFEVPSRRRWPATRQQ